MPWRCRECTAQMQWYATCGHSTDTARMCHACSMHALLLRTCAPGMQHACASHAADTCRPRVGHMAIVSGRTPCPACSARCSTRVLQPGPTREAACGHATAAPHLAQHAACHRQQLRQQRVDAFAVAPHTPLLLVTLLACVIAHGHRARLGWRPGRVGRVEAQRAIDGGRRRAATIRGASLRLRRVRYRH